MLIVSKILSLRYKKNFVQDKDEDIYSRSLKDLCIPEEKQSLLRKRCLKLKTKHPSPSPRQVAQEIEFSQLSSLRDKISLHDETCEELFKEWTLNHTFKKKIHIFNVAKESKEREEEFSSFCPKKREELSQEKDEIIKQIDFFTSKKEETSSDDFFEKEEKELNEEISRLQASFFSISEPKECPLFQKQYEALKKCFIQCKEEYRSSKDRLQKAKTEENMQEKDITTLFPDFYAKKELFLKEMDDYESLKEKTDRNYRLLFRLLTKPSKTEMSFAKELSVSKGKSLRDASLTYLSLLYGVSANMASFKPLLYQKEFYEDVAQRSLKGEDMHVFLTELLSSMGQDKLLENIFELEDSRKEIAKSLSRSNNKKRYLSFLILIEDYDELERHNSAKEGGFLLMKDEKGNNFLHFLFIKNPSFGVRYIKYTKNEKVKELLFHPNDEYLYPLDYLPFKDAKPYIHPNSNERRYIFPSDPIKLPSSFKKESLIRFYKTKCKDPKTPLSEREQMEKDLEKVELETNPGPFNLDFKYLSLGMQLRLDYSMSLINAFKDFSRFEMYLPSFISFEQIKEDIDYCIQSLRFDLLDKYLPLISHLYLFVPSYNIRSYFAKKEGPLDKEKTITVRNIEYALECLISLKKNFFDTGCILKFLATIKEKHLSFAKKIYKEHPTNHLFKKIVALDPYFETIYQNI